MEGSMAAYLKVTKSSMEKDSERIHDLIKTIPELVIDLEHAMGRLAGCWEGPAWAEYQNTVAEHIERMKEMYDDMGRYVVNTKEAAKQYMRTEQDVLAKIKKV